MSKDRTLVDEKAKEIWLSKIENDEVISPTNWISLGYRDPEVSVIDFLESGEGGLPEIVSNQSRFFRDFDICFFMLYGCQIRGKNERILPLRLILTWIPPSTEPLNRTRAILDADEIIMFFEMQFECFLSIELTNRKHISTKYISKKVKDIRGSGIPHSSLFKKSTFEFCLDENVSKLRIENKEHLKELEKNLLEYEKLKKEEEAADLENQKKKLESLRMGESYVLKELIKTERYYVKCLILLNDRFLEPLGTRFEQKKLLALIMSLFKPILRVNTELLADLYKMYGFTNDDSDDDKVFQIKLDTLGIHFFTRKKISDIIDVVLKNFATFKFYGPFVSQYHRILPELSEAICENEELEKYYNEVGVELESQEYFRNTDFKSFLIMPIQRIPRYQLLLNQLLKNTQEPEHNPNYIKIENCLEEVKKIATIVNQNKESRVKVEKTIFLSKTFDIPDLMGQKLIKYQPTLILSSTLINKKKKKKMDKMKGELFLFDSSLLVVMVDVKNKSKNLKGWRKSAARMSLNLKIPKKSGHRKGLKDKGHEVFVPLSQLSVFSGQQVYIGGLGGGMFSGSDKKKKKKKTEDECFRTRVELEMALANPSARCYRNPKYLEILELEGEDKKVVLKFDTEEVCKEMSLRIQGQLKKFNNYITMTSLFASRELFKSWLKCKSASYPVEKNLFHVLYADLKVVVFEKENDRKTMLRSFSLVGGAKYGRTVKKKVSEGVRYGGQGSSGGSTKPATKSSISQSTPSVPWFYISFFTNFQNKNRSKKKRKKKEEETEGELMEEEENKKKVEVKFFFLPKDAELREIWLGVLELIDYCERIDED